MKKRERSKETQTNPKIKAIVDMLFEDIPYSEEVIGAQDKIEAALNTEYDKLKAGRHEDEALEELLAGYGRLSQMAQLASEHRCQQTAHCCLHLCGAGCLGVSVPSAGHLVHAKLYQRCSGCGAQCQQDRVR